MAAPDPDGSGEALDRAAGRMLLEVLRRTHLSSAPDLPVVLAEEARAIGVDPYVLYVLDLEQRCLLPVPGPAAGGREPLPVQGTMAGRAFSANAVVTLDEGADGVRLWLPLLDGTERLGVAELTLPGRRGPLPEALVAVCERLTHLAATLVTNKDLYSDFFKVLRRRRPMTTASELMWGLVPPQVLATDRFVVAALLEPCYDNGGDAYDYSANEDGILHLAIFDAMGHGLAAAGVTAFALSVYRNRRRHGDGPAAMYEAIDAAIAEQYPGSRFVTGVMATLELDTGRLTWVNAGHPPPLLVRGGRLVRALQVVPSPPMGMRLAAAAPEVGEEWLEPGDMTLLFTDGLTEARRPDGALLSVERLAEFLERQAAGEQPAPELLRGLRETIIERGEGALHDDATALLVEWRGDSSAALLPRGV